jgi:hypothetical protein
VFREKFIPTNAYFRQEEGFEINNLVLHVKKLDEQTQDDRKSYKLEQTPIKLKTEK